MSRVYAVGAAAQWDEHRNTSRVFPVPPDALPNAQRALASLDRSDPALVRWITEGHPTLTETEHLERFGEPYARGARRRSGSRPTSTPNE